MAREKAIETAKAARAAWDTWREAVGLERDRESYSDEIEKLRLRAEALSAEANQVARDFARGLEDRRAVRAAYARANASRRNWQEAMGSARMQEYRDSMDESYV
jgi:tryptophan 2,3-dioxygenase